MNTLIARDTAPWYREPWPWLLMLGPAIVIVAGSYAAWLAVSGADAVVESDYYEQGLKINHQLERDATAARLGLSASATLDGGNIRIRLNGATGHASVPASLRLVMVHATRAGQDQAVALLRQADGSYGANIALPASGRWNVALEDRDWRLTARWQLPAAGGLELLPGG